MRYTVTWTAPARRQLAQIWLDAADRDRVLEAARLIERELAANAEFAGESRVVNIRILIESPLAVFFDVRPADRTANVWRIWRFRT